MVDSVENILNSRIEGYENYRFIYPTTASFIERRHMMNNIKEQHPEITVGCCDFYKIGKCIFGH